MWFYCVWRSRKLATGGASPCAFKKRQQESLLNPLDFPLAEVNVFTFLDNLGRKRYTP